jgi:hypothetical protein
MYRRYSACCMLSNTTAVRQLYMRKILNADSSRDCAANLELSRFGNVTCKVDRARGRCVHFEWTDPCLYSSFYHPIIIAVSNRTEAAVWVEHRLPSIRQKVQRVTTQCSGGLGRCGGKDAYTSPLVRFGRLCILRWGQVSVLPEDSIKALAS